MKEKGALVQSFLRKRAERVVTPQAKSLDKAFCLSVPLENATTVMLADTNEYSRPARTVQRGTRFLNTSFKKIYKRKLLDKIEKAIAKRNMSVAQ